MEQGDVTGNIDRNCLSTSKPDFQKSWELEAHTAAAIEGSVLVGEIFRKAKWHITVSQWIIIFFLIERVYHATERQE